MLIYDVLDRYHADAVAVSFIAAFIVSVPGVGGLLGIESGYGTC